MRGAWCVLVRRAPVASLPCAARRLAQCRSQSSLPCAARRLGPGAGSSPGAWCVPSAPIARRLQCRVLPRLGASLVSSELECVVRPRAPIARRLQCRVLRPPGSQPGFIRTRLRGASLCAHRPPPPVPRTAWRPPPCAWIGPRPFAGRITFCTDTPDQPPSPFSSAHAHTLPSPCSSTYCCAHHRPVRTPAKPGKPHWFPAPAISQDFVFFPDALVSGFGLSGARSVFRHTPCRRAASAVVPYPPPLSDCRTLW